MSKPLVGLIGATSLVGRELPSLLDCAGYDVLAFSRREISELPEDLQNAPCRWTRLPEQIDNTFFFEKMDYCICAAPVWVLPQFLSALAACGVRKVVAVSSTSILTKEQSADSSEHETVRLLHQGESALGDWAEEQGIASVVLRPTLIYGRGRDKNLSEIARLIKRLKFFPLLGAGNGLRQPVHAQDVALACVSALQSNRTGSHVYNVCGGSTLPYREMVGQVFTAMGLKPRIVSIPLWLFSLALFFMRLIPRYRKWNAQMARRINVDMVFDDTVARETLGLNPRPFCLQAEDVPQ